MSPERENFAPSSRKRARQRKIVAGSTALVLVIIALVAVATNSKSNKASSSGAVCTWDPGWQCDSDGEPILDYSVNSSGLKQIFTPNPMPPGVSPGADLSWKNFVDTVCCAGLDMSRMNLTGARMDRVDFTKTILTGAIMTGTNVQGATWDHTICPNGKLNVGTAPC